jgi:hypothetical protein
MHESARGTQKRTQKRHAALSEVNKIAGYGEIKTTLKNIAKVNATAGHGGITILPDKAN